MPILGEDIPPAETNAKALTPRDQYGRTYQSRPALSFEQAKEYKNKPWRAGRGPYSRTLEDLKLDAETDDYYKDEYEFRLQDVFNNVADKIQIDLWFHETIGTEKYLDEPAFRKIWYEDDDGCYLIHWRITAQEKYGKFITEHRLINRTGNVIEGEHADAMKLLIRLNPVLRIRDRRMLQTPQADDPKAQNSAADPQIVTQLDTLLGTDDPTGYDITNGLLTLNTLMEKYLSNYSRPKLSVNPDSLVSRNVGDIVNRPISLETLGTLLNNLSEPGINKNKMLVSALAGALTLSMGNREIDWKERPIFIFEDIESRFHPSLLLSFWSIVETMDAQKILTTNSGDLLSAIPTKSIRRLRRDYYDTRSYKVTSRSLNRDDERRIAFHIRLNRPMTLFARCWLLVEGETEIWIISQVASILGMSLQCEGIRPVEFAQCGLSPLIKMARALGIEFHVITDGDEAGQKYSNNVRSMLDSRQAGRHLTVLPHVDIEHYLYHSGYAKVYKEATGIQGGFRKGTTADRIIEMAIRRKTKPGLALMVIEEMQKRGPEGVPQELADMLAKVSELARI